ncbi:hypothetical protein ONZ45_g16785 [Pleurotus djamor]|nr:hypothetical protein ONZ45_g16785 [Pleurotus djamor]
MKFDSLFVVSILAAVVSARPSIQRVRRAEFDLKNGQDAIALNNVFKTLQEGAPCQLGEIKCVGDKFAQCVNGKLLGQTCAPGTSCAALPQSNQPGTFVACTTADDLARRLAATGAQNAGNNDNGNNNNDNGQNNGGNSGNNAGGNNGNNGNNGNGNNDPQTSLTLDPKVIAPGFANDGQDVPTAGQVASLTSTNNFINFCLTRPDLPITNGQQIQSGSCNPAPIGLIPSVDRMPSSKFTFPTNFGTVAANQQFTISMAITNLETGNFVNANKNYFAAPQQLNGQGIIRGHSHVVIEKIESFTSTTPLDPKKFQFFKGLNGAAQGGILTATVDKGLPVGFYRLASINTAANHQPAIVPVAQHGSLDDAIYFSVTENGQAAAAPAAAPASFAATPNNNNANSGNGNQRATPNRTGANRNNGNAANRNRNGRN